MITSRTISTDTPWLRLNLEEADWRAEDPKALAGWLEQMLLIRRFEEKILDLHSAGLIHGPAHAAIGQEAGAVGAMSALGREDKIHGTHRAHHHVLRAGARHRLPQERPASTARWSDTSVSSRSGRSSVRSA